MYFNTFSIVFAKVLNVINLQQVNLKPLLYN